MTNKIVPEQGMHFKNIKTGDIYEGMIYLGKYDNANNYIQVTEEEYQEWLVSLEKEVEDVLRW